MSEECKHCKNNLEIACGNYKSDKNKLNFEYRSYIDEDRIINSVKTLWGTSIGFGYKINYCPMCGEKL